MTEKRAAATNQILRHVRRARESLDRLERAGTSSEGVLSNPAVQNASLKIAAEEIRKALTLIESIKWRVSSSA